MAEINPSNQDLINIALDYQDDLTSELFYNIISRSDRAEAYYELLKKGNESVAIADREEAYLERIRLANSIIAQYITREF